MLRAFVLAGGLLLGLALLARRKWPWWPTKHGVYKKTAYHLLWPRGLSFYHRADSPCELCRRTSKSSSAPGHRNGPVPTSSPPSDLNPAGIRERFLRAADTVGFSRSGAERLLDIAGIARGSQPPPRTTSEQVMNCGANGGTEASTP